MPLNSEPMEAQAQTCTSIDEINSSYGLKTINTKY